MRDLVLVTTIGAFLVVSPGCRPRESDIEAAIQGIKQGQAEPQYKLGLAYVKGDGVREDLSEAVSWFRKAADQGHAEAQFKLGIAYEHGTGVRENLAEAMAWFRKAADQGHAEATVKLGLACAEGKGVHKDLAEARRLLHEAADQGHADAQFGLGRAYELDQRGPYLGGISEIEIVRAKPSEAQKWFRKAAEQGHRAAIWKAYQYANGKGGFLWDSAEAVKWLRKAADQGHAEAQLLLGLSYVNGKGVSKDDVMAYKWFLLAEATTERAETGGMLAQTEMRLTPEQRAEGQKLAREFRQKVAAAR